MARSKIKALKFAATSLGALLVGSSLSFAQLGNGGSSLGDGITNHDIGSGIVSKKLDGLSSATGGPAGPGLSRLPLTTLEETPLGGSGVTPEDVGSAGSSADPEFTSEAYGTHSDMWPYSHQRVAVYGNPGPSVFSFQIPVTSRPYRFTGKLWARWGGSWFVCTASLIKKGILITAAHCIHNYGGQAGGFADEVRWYPANYNSGGGAWGYYTAENMYIPTVYFNGNDTCTTVGIVCNNDIATVVLQIRNGLYAGAAMGGWYGYGWNGYSYPTSSPAFGNHRVASITQLGYPVAWDGGWQMQRNNSFGKLITATGTNGQQMLNTQLGSPLSGGSSGGPWLVNFGTYPVLTNASDASYGTARVRNVVVGTTSWGYVNKDLNVQGASWFGQNFEFPNANYGGRGAGNIGGMVDATCTAYPTHC